MPSSHLILCRPLLLLPPIPPSIRVFSNESSLHMTWSKYWSFSFSSSSEYSGLISFRIDWLDLLAVHGIFQARVLEWGAIAFSFTACKGHSQNTTPSSTISWELMFVLHRPGTCASGTLGDLTGSTHLLRGRGRPSVHRITLLQKHPAGRIL